MSTTKKLGKIESMILCVVSIIDLFRVKQERTNPHNMNLRISAEAVRNQMEKFVIAMDNYFTLPKSINALRYKGIGIVGTARFRQSWPPEKLRKINQTEATFNDFYYCYDNFGTLIARWLDYGLVFCVSTVHKVGEIVMR